MKASQIDKRIILCISSSINLNLFYENFQKIKNIV